MLITTGRQLRTHGLAGSAVVMLDADCSYQSCPADTRIWWGAYLGTEDELLVAGTVGEVGPASRRCAPTPAPGTAGSWIPIYCGLSEPVGTLDMCPNSPRSKRWSTTCGAMPSA